MRNTFKHLRLEHRLYLAHMLENKLSKRAIAQKLGVHRSTIYRELKRNYDPEFGYHILIADYKARKRQLDQRQRKINRNSALKDYVTDQLKEGWSPDQIAGRLRMNLGKTVVCHETIYAYIYSPQGITEGLYKYLPSRKPKRYSKIHRRTRVLIPNRICILDRPAYINDRSEFGHWEADFMLFNKASKSNFLTLRERKTRYLIAIKNTTRCAETVASALLSGIENRYKKAVKSITFDNDLGFAQHERIGKMLNANTYFCEPYKSYQKGSIENGNRLLRGFFPRTVDLATINQQHLNSIVYQLNSRPMKCLNYKSPYELFQQYVTCSA